MTQENDPNKQEQAVAESTPKPFDPKDEARIAELNAKFENKEQQTGPDNFTVENGGLSIGIDSFTSIDKDGLIFFKASQVDRSDTSTSFKGGLSRDIEYAVFKQGDSFHVQKILNPKSSRIVQGVGSEEAESVLRSKTVAKHLN